LITGNRTENKQYSSRGLLECVTV